MRSCNLQDDWHNADDRCDVQWCIHHDLRESKKEKNSKGAAVNFIAAIVTQIQTARNNHCKEKYLNLNSSCNPLKIILQLFFATAQKDSSEEACSRLPVCGHDTTERNKEGGLERPRLLPYSLCVPIMACLLTPGTDYTRCARWLEYWSFNFQTI